MSGAALGGMVRVLWGMNQVDVGDKDEAYYT